jgi:hypothetical protein
LDPLKCSSNVSTKQIMDRFDDIQIEEFSSFDFVEEMNEGLFDEDEEGEQPSKFNLNEYINGNYDY